ncbi:hypothetical protein PF003_g25147 [Phytophthora fragariae]|nr:hypothetical protein PF003_g25147 [Phytophthora fragariae]
MGRDRSSDEDFVMVQAAADPDDSPDDSPDQGPLRKKTRTQGKPDVQARPKKGRKAARRVTRGRVSTTKLKTDMSKLPTPELDTPKTPPAPTPDKLPTPKPDTSTLLSAPGTPKAKPAPTLPSAKDTLKTPHHLPRTSRSRARRRSCQR